MARGITEQDVLEAADALLARGERPTIERVRQELGRGSPNTVNRHLDAWWTSLAVRIQGNTNSALPSALLDLCGRLYAGMQAQAQAESAAQLEAGQARLDAERVDIHALKASHQVDLAAAAATSERLSAELAALQARNEILAAEKAELRAEAQRLVAVAAEADAGSIVSRTALEAAQSKHATELERVRKQWEGNETRWLKEIDHLRDESKRQRVRHEAEIKVLKVKLKTVEEHHAAAIKAKADIEGELRQRESQLRKEREARLQAEAASKATKALVDAMRKPGSRTPKGAAKASGSATGA